MFRILRLVASVLFIFGMWEITATALFVRGAIDITGLVAPSDQYRGPPRSPRAIPFNVSFVAPGGRDEIIVSLPSPLLMRVKVGTPVKLLVNPQQLNEARLNLLSELWTYPGGLLLGSVILFLVATAALKVRSPYLDPGTPR